MQKKVNLPATLKEIGITQAQLNENMSRLVTLTNESASAAMTPRVVSNAEVKQLLEYAWIGKSVDF